MLLEGKHGTEQTPVMVNEKDRYGVLAGRRFAKPTGDTIASLFPYLGTDEIAAEDEDERLAADAELLSQREEKAEKKRERSTALLKEYEAKIRACKTVDEIGAAGAELKKQKRYLIEQHLTALRTIYDSVRDEIVQATAGSV